MPAHYDPETLVEVFCIFENTAGAPTNPTVVVLVVGADDLESVTWTHNTDPEITNPAVGDFRAQFKPSVLFPGVYGPIWYRWIGDGIVTIAQQGYFVVDQPKVFAT